MVYNLEMDRITDILESEGFDIVSLFFRKNGVDHWSTFVYAILDIDGMTLSIKIHNNCIIVKRKISFNNADNVVRILYGNSYKSLRNLVSWEKMEFKYIIGDYKNEQEAPQE